MNAGSRYAVFAACQHDESPFVEMAACLYSHPRWRRWVGDAHKFGPHVTVRGVFELAGAYSEWARAVTAVACRQAPIPLGSPRLVDRFPAGVAVTYRTSAEAQARLARLVVEIAEVTRPFVGRSQVTADEVAETRAAVRGMGGLADRSSVLLQRLAEVERRVVDATLPPLPTAPEYRLPLLIQLWDRPARRDALLRYGDPLVVDFQAHLTLLTLGPGVPPGDLQVELESRRPGTFDGNDLMLRLYLMAEDPTRTVPVVEHDMLRDRHLYADRPGWRVEQRIPLGDGS